MAIVAYVKETQGVGTSAEMDAPQILSWCERLAFMDAAGDLEEFLGLPEAPSVDEDEETEGGQAQAAS